ncbi:MAG: hypothetical protein LBI16_01300 [Burkholderiales bacterium]|nr:hypothetical protein [Burkholderiales bacterium]
MRGVKFALDLYPCVGRDGYVRSEFFLKKDGNGISARRRWLVNAMGLIGVGAVTGALTGCAYPKVKEIDKKTTRNYYEKINQVMISQDEKYFVVLCDQYHYIIDVDFDLLKALKSSLRPKLIAAFSDFSVSGDNDLRGSLILILSNNSDEEDLRAVKSELGFSKSPQTPNGVSRKYAISGKRYDAGGFQLPETVTKLNKEYGIHVVEHVPLSEEDKELKANLTPIASMEEGVMIIVAATMMLLIVPWMIAEAVHSISKAAKSAQKPTPAEQ